MAIDALTYISIVNELNQLLSNGKITKITQPEKDELLLNVYNGKNYKLLLSANSSVTRMHLTEQSKNASQVAPSFCMLLRKHLQNATINSFYQMPFERVVTINFTNLDDLGFPFQRKLIFELTGKSANIVLTTEDYTILGTLRTTSNTFFDENASRQFLTGMKYTFFLPQDKISPNNSQSIKQILLSSLDYKTTLYNNILGASRQSIDEIIYGLELNENTLSILTVNTIIDRFNSFLNCLNNTTMPVIVLDKLGYYQDVYAVKNSPNRYGKIEYNSINKAFDDFFIEKDRVQRYKENAKHISTVIKNAINRTEKKLGLQKQALLESEKAQVFQDYGNLILSNIYRIKPQDKKIDLENYYDNNQLITIDLDPALSAQQNAQVFFKKANKMKKSAEYNQKLISENTQALTYYTTLLESIKYSSDTQDLKQITQELIDNKLIIEKKKQQKQDNKKNKKPIKPSAVQDIGKSLLEYSILDYKVLVGKNNTQNDFLTHKIAKDDDIWLHAKDVHSAHVVILNPQKTTVPDQVIVIAAQITVFFSQSRDGGKTAVDYTEKRYLKKVSKSKLGFVTYTNNSTILVEPNEHIHYKV